MSSFNSYTCDIKVSEVCRLCLIKKDDMLHIFDNENKNSTSLPTKIMACVSIEILEGDGLPYLICHQCAFQIDSWYEFKIQCQSTDATLREYLDKQHTVNGKSSTYEESGARLKRSRKRVLGPLSKSNEVPSTAENKNSETKPLLQSLNELDKEEISVYPSLPPDVQLDMKYAVKLEENNEIIQKDIQEENIFPNVKSFPCTVCQKSFSSRYYLRDHESIHSREEDFYCSDCGKAFFSKHKLVVHLKTHSAERPFLCSICGKAYRKKFELKQHFLMHSDESPYLCNVCGKSFKTKFSLKNHMFVHSSEKKYMCAECGKAFRHPETLRKHAKVHVQDRPIICTVCNKGFKRKDHLERHTLIHTVEKPFTCPYCARSFTGKWNLTQHIRLHTGQKPYVCSVCSKAFTHNVTLRNHVKQHHPETQKPDSDSIL